MVNIQHPFKERINEINVAIDAIYESGNAVMKVYDQNFTSSVKDDKSPITEADIQSNEILQKHLSQIGFTILSEESIDDKIRLEQDYVWIIDPLDGTSDFINRTGEFTVMVALVKSKIPILGLVYWPLEDKLFIAHENEGAYVFTEKIWKKIHVNKIQKLEDCEAVGSRHHLSEHERKFLDELKLEKFTEKGSSLKAMDISSGNSELYITTTNKIKQWDTCASNCILRESGGKMTDIFGNELEYNTENVNHENGILATNSIIHNEVVTEYKNFLNKTK